MPLNTLRFGGLAATALIVVAGCTGVRSTPAASPAGTAGPGGPSGEPGASASAAAVTGDLRYHVDAP